jgi:hypothetical protein
MIGGENFESIVRQVFQLGTLKELSYSFCDIESMIPFERVAYFDLVEEQRNERRDAEEKEQERLNKENLIKGL